MRHTIFLSVVLCPLFQFILAQSYDPNGQLLWEIKTPKGISYLFGTLHSNDKRLFDLPDSVYVAFNSSDKLGVEVNIFDLFINKDPVPVKNYLLIDPKGKLYTSSSEATQTYYGDENGMPQFMDAWFQEKAELLKKPVIALETLAQQTKAFEAIPYLDKEQTQSALAAESDRLMAFYLKGRIDLIDRLIKGGLSGDQEAYGQLIEKRNQFLGDIIEQEINNSTCFFAVGSGHLFGEKGLVAILRSKGYVLRAVQLTKQDKSTEAEKKIKKTRDYVFNEQWGTSAISAVFPGLPRQKDISSDLRIKSIVYKELGQGNTYELQWFNRDTSLSILEYSEILIASPSNSPYVFGILDDGTEYTQGLSDAYPEGLKWVRIFINETHVILAGCSGGNKFMNSDRPNRFFNHVILD